MMAMGEFWMGLGIVYILATLLKIRLENPEKT